MHKWFHGSLPVPDWFPGTALQGGSRFPSLKEGTGTADGSTANKGPSGSPLGSLVDCQARELKQTASIHREIIDGGRNV